MVLYAPATAQISRRPMTMIKLKTASVANA